MMLYVYINIGQLRIYIHTHIFFNYLLVRLPKYSPSFTDLSPDLWPTNAAAARASCAFARRTVPHLAKSRWGRDQKVQCGGPKIAKLVYKPYKP